MWELKHTHTRTNLTTGTYSDSTSLVSRKGCNICPKGFACGLGITSAELLPCVAGSYCPAGSIAGSETPCPGGTYSYVTHLGDITECIQCLPGSYCSGGGIAVSGPCAKGHVCPAGSTYATQYPCTAGTYSSRTDLFDLAQCTECPPGSYCFAGSTSITPCPSGSYASQNRTQLPGPGTYPSCLSCTAGSYCPLGAPLALPCGTGSYSPPLSASCSVCPRGYYCG